MTKGLVSVIIPTYNRSKDLKRAVLSVLNQSYAHFEIIIVDNCSTDNSEEMILSFNNSKIHFLKIKNEGVIAKSRNVGLLHARGEFIAFLDSDDWWHHQKLALSVQALNEGADFIYHPLFLVKSQSQILYLRKTFSQQLEQPFFDDLLVKGNVVSNSSVVLKKKFVNNSLNESNDLVGMEDYDFWLQLAKTNLVFRKISKTLGYYWVGGGNVSNTIRQLNNIRVIKCLYAPDFSRISEKGFFSMLHYQEIRCLLKMGKRTEALALYSNIKSQKIPFLVRVKLFILISTDRFS